ncbi:hypothetical protein [Burkholderia perseverans]|uniref:hypothetical protein n=1 Tax=Burkholderia perseverans TaxID=2615214 RepID=UPI001FEE4C68|nr:hypothetical protein [Burkholderia perseverans]
MIVPEAEKPLAPSLYGAVFGPASVIGQAPGGILISPNLSGMAWRTIFLVNLPVAILVVLFGIPLLKETRAEHARELDLVGTALSMATPGAPILPLIEGREAGWPLWSCLGLASVPALAWLFWRYESRLAGKGGAPLLDPAAITHAFVVAALCIAFRLAGGATLSLARARKPGMRSATGARLEPGTRSWSRPGTSHPGRPADREAGDFQREAAGIPTADCR